ncbi:cytochrome P450 [Polyplosphaeria fusca]|uniref:Cytochrome P450 n=1 Tax=Polyplosphaeria fusca TaxID=682080 RepID=A0A9P4RA78_9PLEO|nr:cytochrome P450 [Polyplosphaeria fusca]
MELQSIAGFSHTVQTAAVATIIFAACICFSQINWYKQFSKLPAFTGNQGSFDTRRKAYHKSARQMYTDGYAQFKDRVYRMSTTENMDCVVVPPRFLPELRKLPDSVLSFPKCVEESMESKYTFIDPNEPIGTHTVKADLTPALVRLNPTICAEVEEAVKEEIPASDDWTEVPIYMAIARIVAKVSGRVFVGPELYKHEDYLDAGLNYTMELISAQRAIKQMKPIWRPFLAPRLPEVRRLKERERQATSFLEPVVKARREAEKNPDYQKPDDMLQWNMDRGAHLDAAQHAKLQLGFIFAAIHTTSITATNILYNLAVTPEYIPPLRDEIRTVMAQHNGVITSRALQQMEKLDSYMKESMRFHPISFTSMRRKVLRPFTLSNNQYIPAGVTIEVPAHAVYQDATHYPDSTTFDGFRFWKLRQAGEGAARNQFVTSNEQNLNWGYGRHACPGRFFAANEIKMILARVVLEFDVGNVGGGRERYENLEMGRSTSPDPRKKLLFRKAAV